MGDKDEGEYINIDEYFQEHPDEEAEFYDEMCRLSHTDEILEYPEDW